MVMLTFSQIQLMENFVCIMIRTKKVEAQNSFLNKAHASLWPA